MTTNSTHRAGKRRTGFFTKSLRASMTLLLLAVVGLGIALSRGSQQAKEERRDAASVAASPQDSPGLKSPKTRQDSSRKIADNVAQQIQALIAEKESRTPTQRKIDSQLLQAIRESRGRQMTTGVHLDRANVNADNARRLEVDISTAVNDDLLSKIEGLGGEIPYPSWKYKSVRARVNLSAVEAIAS